MSKKLDLLTLSVFFAGILTLPCSRSIADDAPPAPYKKFPSPNGRLVVRLREGQTIGNAAFDRAELLDARTGKVLYQFPEVGGEASEGFAGDDGGFGGFDHHLVFWSRDSRCVALMCHDHRTGETDVVKLIGNKVQVCTLPEVVVPRIERAFQSGRQWQTWLEPAAWTKADVLVAKYSGTIRNYREMPQRKDSEGQLNYEYSVQFLFDAAGVGKVTSIKRLHFEKDYVP